jgi:hypothetical protein
MSVAIVGLGYVGLPLAMEFAEAGVDVIGIDIDAPRVASLRTGTSHIEDVSDERLRAALDRCSFTTRMVDAHDADAVLICVPTPLNANREPELGALLSVGRGLGSVIRAGAPCSTLRFQPGGGDAGQGAGLVGVRRVAGNADGAHGLAVVAHDDDTTGRCHDAVPRDAVERGREAGPDLRQLLDRGSLEDQLQADGRAGETCIEPIDQDWVLVQDAHRVAENQLSLEVRVGARVGRAVRRDEVVEV